MRDSKRCTLFVHATVGLTVERSTFWLAPFNASYSGIGRVRGARVDAAGTMGSAVGARAGLCGCEAERSEQPVAQCDHPGWRSAQRADIGCGSAGRCDRCVASHHHGCAEPGPLLQRGELTPFATAHFHHVFRAFDHDMDGSFSLAEFNAYQRATSVDVPLAVFSSAEHMRRELRGALPGAPCPLPLPRCCAHALLCFALRSQWADPAKAPHL